jgi:sarcosine/dimethylglycine N-methyltransferase
MPAWLPPPAASFGGALSMNVTMNIADKASFFLEIYRVLKAGGWFALVEIAQGSGGAPRYPTPWARTAAASFLATPEQTERALKEIGFVTETLRTTTRETLAYAALAREIVERGEEPPHRAVQLVHGEAAKEMAANSLKGVAEGRLVPIEIFCKKP